jgi:hypothetical protein
MSATTHLMSRFISDKMCEGKSTGMCEPFSDVIQTVLGVIGVGFFAFCVYYSMKEGKKNKEVERQPH